jgi:hypothetical protein
MRDAFVYFIKPVGQDGPVKIGVSVTTRKRLEALAAWSPAPLEIVVSIPGDRSLEQNLHQCFDDLLIHHEWFRADPRITALMDKLLAGVPVGEAIDLNDRKIPDMSSKARAWVRNPEARLRCSYNMRLGWAERKLNKASNDYWAIPADVTLIMRRWGGIGHVQASPGVHEIARLDQVLSAPSEHYAVRRRQAA